MRIGWLENWLDNSEQSIKRMQLRIKGRRKGSDSAVRLYAYGVRDYLQFIDVREGPDTAIQSMRKGKINPSLTIGLMIFCNESVLEPQENILAV